MQQLKQADMTDGYDLLQLARGVHQCGNGLGISASVRPENSRSGPCLGPCRAWRGGPVRGVASWGSADEPAISTTSFGLSEQDSKGMYHVILERGMKATWFPPVTKALHARPMVHAHV